MEITNDTIKLDDLIKDFCDLIKDQLSKNKFGIGNHINLSGFIEQMKIKEIAEKLNSNKTDGIKAVLELFYYGKGGGTISNLNLKNGLSAETQKQIINAVGQKNKLTTFLKLTAKDNDEDKEKDIYRFGQELFTHLNYFNDKLYSSKNKLETFFNEIYEKAGLNSKIKQDINYPVLNIANNIPNAIYEILYCINVLEDYIPLINGCAIDAIKYIQEIEGKKYNLEEGIEYIKKKISENIPDKPEIYENQIKFKIPYYFISDVFFNVIHKIKSENEYDKNEDIQVKDFYRKAWNYIGKSKLKRKQNSFDNEFDKILGIYKNIIFYGAPGTGKTYQVQKTIEEKIKQEELDYSEYVEFIQFHPSFTYEDFIEGLKPLSDSNGIVKFQLVNGVFKEFCKKAFKDIDNNYYFIIDEINRAELSRVFGEILYCLEYRIKINGTTNGLIKTQYSSYIKSLEKEEREKLSVYYDEQKNESYFGIPENVYVIGTMNDVDRSIDTFDLALRRRFIWIRKDYDNNVLKTNLSEYENVKKYIEICDNLNKFIKSSDNGDGLDLGINYQIGHAYFLKISEYANSKVVTPKNVTNLFNYHLKPLLKEYLRAKYNENQIDLKLQKAEGIFSLKN